jgi:hypothetical protein
MRALWWCVAIVAAAALLPVLYVLSFGPVRWLAGKGWIPIEAYWAYVDPIDRVLAKDSDLYALIVSYLQAWYPDKPEP